jgi:hypothetical protein
MGPELVRRLAASAVAVLVVAGAGALARPAAAQDGDSEPSTGPTAVQVTEADHGRTVRLVPGQELAIELDAPSGEQWQGPTSSGPLYLVAYSESGTRTAARLEALRAETSPVVLRARTDRSCFHSDQPCPQGFREWSLNVVVDPGPPASGAYGCMPMPTPSLARGHALVEDQDDGRRVTVELGKTVQVYLRACDDPYSVPTAAGPLFRGGVSYRAHGLNHTSFQALRLGTTTIQAQSDPACFHSANPCARPAVLFEVEVEVVPATPDDSCLTPTAVVLDRSTVVATGEAGLTVRSAPGSVVDLFAYTRPATDYRLVRTGTVASDGSLRFALRPPANTRMYAQQRGCVAGPQVVQDVATALTLAVERRGPRQYLFHGDSLPARMAASWSASTASPPTVARC